MDQFCDRTLQCGLVPKIAMAVVVYDGFGVFYHYVHFLRCPYCSQKIDSVLTTTDHYCSDMGCLGPKRKGAIGSALTFNLKSGVL